MKANITNVKLRPSEKREKMQRDIDYLLEQKAKIEAYEKKSI